MRRYGLGAAGRVVMVVGVIVLFLEPAEYFFGDSIAVLWGRPHSVGSLVKDFARLDGGHWYRPLSNSLPPFLLWPLFGMAFRPYHLVAIAFHVIFCIGLFEIFRRLLHDPVAAFVSSAFFAFHPIQFYATYDIAFYQDPMMTALTIASVFLALRFIERERRSFLVASLVIFLAALVSKETSVTMPGLLMVLLLGRPELCRLRSARIALLSTGVVAATFAFIYARVLGVSFRYQPGYRPRLGVNAIGEAIRGLLWSFGIPSGYQTQGWHYPPGIYLGLWLLVVVIVAVAIARPTSRVWFGIAWFLVGTSPAFFTPHLLPHHLYLGLVGIAYSVGQTVAWMRTRQAHQAWASISRRTAYGLAASSLALIFCAAFLDARADVTQSWVGQSSRRVQSTADFVRAAKINIFESRGIVADIEDAEYLRFDWMEGALFNLIGSDKLEVQLINWEPEDLPAGVDAVKYAGNSLHRIEATERLSSDASAARPIPSTVAFHLTAGRVYAGRDSYCLNVPQFPGQMIDVKYHYNQRPASVAYSFARLDRNGTACINVPASVPWGKVKVVGVRPSGSWR